MLLLSREDIRRALPMAAAMEAVAEAFAELARGQAEVPLRPQVRLPPAEGTALVMPAYLAGSGALGVIAACIEIAPDAAAHDDLRR